MMLYLRSRAYDHAARQMIADSRRKRGMISGGHLHVVMARVGAVRGIDPNHEHRPSFVGAIGGPAMNGQRGPRRNVPALRQFLDCSFEEAAPLFARREHPARKIAQLDAQISGGKLTSMEWAGKPAPKPFDKCFRAALKKVKLPTDPTSLELALGAAE